MATDHKNSRNELGTSEKSGVTPTTIEQSLKYKHLNAERYFGAQQKLENQSMPGSQPALSPLVSLLPGEHRDIRLDVNELLANGEEWLATPNIKYGGRSPSELIGTPDEVFLRYTLRSVLYSGMA